MRNLWALGLTLLVGCAGRKLVKVAEAVNDIKIIETNYESLKMKCWSDTLIEREQIEAALKRLKGLIE